MVARNAARTLLLFLSLAGTASAQTCNVCEMDPATSSVPQCVTLVGRSGDGVPDPAGVFTVTIRDLAFNPLPNVLIRVDLSACPDLSLCSSQQAGVIVSAVSGAMYAEGRTNGAGQLSLSLVGASSGAGSAVTLLGGGRIYADGRLIGSPTVAALDLDGVGGVGINDLSVWLADFASALPYGRSDYDCNGSVGINDLAVWLGLYGASASAHGCTP